MIVEFARELRSDIEAAITTLVVTNGRGCATDWADYRYKAGIVLGLERARDHVNDTLKKYLEDTE